MSRVLNSKRNRMIGAVVGITALILVIFGLWLQLRIVPDAEGFLPPTPTSLPSAGEVIVSSPSAGDTLYAELIRLTGEINITPQSLVAHILDVDNNLLASAPLMTQFGAWMLEMPRPDYFGEANVQVVSASDPTMIYATIPVFLADMANRPSGTFGSIITPADGDQVGGDTILVSGRASGIVGDKIQLVLQSGDGTTVIHDVVINNPYGVDDVLWQTDLSLTGLSGSVTLTAYFTPSTDPNPILTRVTLVITQVAG
jgi:hypothetical protein